MSSGGAARGPAALRDAAALAALAPRALAALARADVLAPVAPWRLARMLAAPARLGTGAATLCAATAARWPDQTALVDERGALTYEELDRRGAALAAALRDQLGVGPGVGLSIMCRNHRGFAEAMLAGSRLGADLLLLNTDFPGPQLAQVVEREQPAVAILDEEFLPAFDASGFDGQSVLAWHDQPVEEPTVDSLIASAPSATPHSRAQGRLVVLTSGTTGTPKGAARSPALRAVLGPMTTLLSRVPFRAREPIVIAPPFFHGFGLAYLAVAMLLGATVIAGRRFDPAATLAAIDQHRASALVVVPVMLKRIMDLPREESERRDTSALRIIVSAAAPLSPGLAAAAMDRFGDVLYNLYGTTEAGFAAAAGPEDLRAAPGTVGRPPLGVELRILDEAGEELPRGETGRVFVGGAMIFEGYTAGGGKEMVDGLMHTGDLGHLDAAGRLFISGRDDDMIVSGGENVFAGEVEQALAGHPAVSDVAVVGVPDEEFGQRLRAFVVAESGAEPTTDDLKAHVKSKLARYKVPRDVVFVSEIPRNPTGKVRLADLREHEPA